MTNLSVDIGYTDLGKIRFTDGNNTLDISTDGLTLGANVMTPINGQLTLFARLGYFDWNASYSPAIPNPEVDSGSDFLYGAGILVGWDNLKFKAGYTRFKVDKFNVDVYGGGFQYYFPVN